MGAFDAARELDPLNDAGAAELDRRILHGPLEVVSVGTLAGRIRRDEASVRRLVGLPVSDEAPDVGADLPADDPGTLVLELAAAPGVLRARLLHVLAVIGPPPHKVAVRLVLEHITDEDDRSEAEDALMHLAGVAVARESLLGIRASRPAPDEARDRATVAAGETRIGRRDVVAGGVVATPIAAIVADLAAVEIAVPATGIGAVGLAGASWLGMRRAGRRSVAGPGAGDGGGSESRVIVGRSRDPTGTGPGPGGPEPSVAGPTAPPGAAAAARSAR